MTARVLAGVALGCALLFAGLSLADPETFFSGTVLDASTGRPLAGATVQVTASDGAPPAAGLQVTTGTDGRFQLTVDAGLHDITISHPERVPVFRLVSASAGQGTDVLDPRLEKLAAAKSLGATGGMLSGSTGARLVVPAGALADSRELSLTVLGEQSLPALLPYGWSPRGAAWLETAGAAFAVPATLHLPVESPAGAVLTIAELDVATLRWRALGTATVAAGEVSFEVEGLGAYAALEPDTGALAPPATVVGGLLSASPTPVGDEVSGANLAFNPPRVLPNQSAEVTVTYPLRVPAASGMPVQLRIAEDLTLGDGSVVRPTPYDADLIVYRSPGGDARSRFKLKPSSAAAQQVIVSGGIDVTVSTYEGGQLHGDVVGAGGGTIAGSEGDTLEVPAGAVSAPVAVVVRRRTVGDLLIAPPVGGTVEGVVEIDLGGAELALPGRLAFALGPAPDAPHGGLLLEQVTLGSELAWRVVAEIEPTATSWATKTIVPADLPWPGVRHGGTFVFLSLGSAHGFARGTVRDAAAAALAGATVEADSVAWLQQSGADGRYALPLPVGTSTLTASHASSGDLASATATVTTEGERVDVDLDLQPVPPWVVEITPADGAVNIPVGIEPQVRFSEPVDPATLEGAIVLLREEVPVEAELIAQGALVTVSPASPLLPLATYELRVSTNVLDQGGTPLASSAAVSFTTGEVVLPATVRRERMRAIAPNAQGLAKVEGLAGAAPAGALLWVENLTSMASIPSTPSIPVSQDGSFELEISAVLADRLILHILVEGANELAFELYPFLSSDLRAAFIDTRPASFTTGEGVVIGVPADTFDAATWVRLETRPLEPAPLAAPEGFEAVVAFDLSFGGARARKPLELRLPAPAGTPDGTFLLARQVTALGIEGWETDELLRLEAGQLTNAPPAPVPQAATKTKGKTKVQNTRAMPLAGSTRWARPTPEARPSTRFAPPVDVLAEIDAEGMRQLLRRSGKRSVASAQLAIEPAPKATPTTPGDYLPGPAFAGHHRVLRATKPVSWVLIQIPEGGDFAAYNHLFGATMIVIANLETRPLLPYAALALPGFAGQPLDLEIRDLTTGWTAFRGPITPPPAGEIEPLPPDLWGDDQPPVPLAGSPVRFHLIQAAGPAVEQIAPGLEVERDGPTLRITGSAHPEAGVRLLDLDDQSLSSVTADATGAFSVERALVPGGRYLLAIAGRLRTAGYLELSFNEALDQALLGIEVRDSGGRLINAHVEPVGSHSKVRLRPPSGWVAGQYQLRFTSALADAFGNTWSSTFEVPFEVVRGSAVGGTELGAIQDMARFNSLLIVAALEQGVRIVDARDPRQLRNYLSGTLGLPFPQGEPVRGVAVDGHGRVVVVGGGAASFGQLKLLDLQADPPAYRGSTILSDPPSGVATQLPEGVPRRVAVVSNDDRDAWQMGKPLPAGLSSTPAPTPERPFLVDFHGTATPNHPVTLRNLTRGTFRREDAAADGSFTIALEVERGDELELLRNRDAVAYVTLDGAGLAVVDLGAVWGEDLGDPQQASQVIRFYDAYPLPAGVVCDPGAVSGSALPTDVAVLTDPGGQHPLVVATLLRTFGLGLLEAALTAPDQLAPLAEQCGAVNSRAVLTGLDVLQGYGFDFDGDDEIEPNEERDLALLSHGDGWLLIVDVSDRAAPTLIGKIKLPGQAAALVADREGRRVLVAGFGAGIHIVDLDLPPTLQLVDADANGRDDRVLETIELPGEDVRQLLAGDGGGIAYASDAGGGLTGLALAPPRTHVLAKVEDRLVVATQLAPFGQPGAEGRGGVVRVRLELPGGLADLTGRLKLDLLSLGAGGLEIAGAGADQPPTGLQGENALVLFRQSNQPWQEGYNLFLSEPVVLLADLRASAKIARTTKENDACDRCDLIEQEVYPDATTQANEPLREILSGHSLGVRFPRAQRVALAELYGDFLLDEAEIEVPSVRWARSPAVRQEPTLNPSQGTGDAVPGTLLHSGEMTLTATDLAISGRRFEVAFTRTYRSQAPGDGPLGPGWDHVYNQSLRDLSNGDVDFLDGRGRRERFKKQPEDGTYEPPPGRFVSLEKVATGWVMIEPGGERRRFNPFGQLIEIADALRTSETTGNALRFTYNAKDELVEIRDDLDRAITLEYESNHLSKIRDFSGREFSYGYDTSGRLITVGTPPVKTIESPLSEEPLVTRYAYATATGNETQKLHQRDDLISITDAKNQTWLELTYTDADSDGRAQEVTSQRWGAGTVQLTYDFAQGETTVTDRRGNLCRYNHNENGQVTRIEDPAQAVWSFSHDDEGLITEQTEPLGRRTEIVFETQGNRRSRGNVREIRVTADSRGPNGSAPVLVTSTEYEEITNKPTRIVDPRGAVTTIERNEAGLPLTITRAAGAPEASTTRTTYNAHGQPVEITNPNGNKRRFDYFTSGTSKGYPQKVTIDPGGLAITTRWETDPRGNVTATIDPRGVRHEQDFNALDWLVETQAAVTGAGIDAPPLSYRNVFRYDANGELSEEQRPFGFGNEFTRKRYERGELGEILAIEEEPTPGATAIRQELRYDEALDLIRHTDGEGLVRELIRDARGLVTEIRQGVGVFAEPITEQFTYDAERQLTATTDARGFTWETVYDGYGRAKEGRDPLGNRTQLEYDTAGALTETRALDAVDELLARETTTYDLLSRPLTSGRWLLGQTPRELREQYTWNPASELLSITDPLGRVSRWERDAAERVTATQDPLGNRNELGLDEAGNAVSLSEVELVPGGNAETRMTTFAHDALGRQVNRTDALGNTERWEWSAQGAVSRSIDAEGNATLSEVDALGRQTRLTRPEGLVEIFNYDRASRLIRYADAQNHTTLWQRDVLGRLERLQLPDGGAYLYERDAAGNPTKITDPNGSEMVQSFDARGLLTSRTSTLAAGVVGPTLETFTHDGLGRLKIATSGTITSQFAWDSLSRLLSEETLGRKVGHQLDDAGNAIELHYPSGLRLLQSFDGLDRLQALGRQTAEEFEPRAAYTFRGADRVHSQALAAQLRGARGYDTAGRPTSAQIGLIGATQPAFQEQQAWSPRGLKNSTSRLDNNGNGWQLSHDGANRLLQATAPGSQPDRWSFSYDAVDNQTARQRYERGALKETVAMPPESSGRNRPSAVGGVLLGWDANGNLTSKGNLRFAYDIHNRLTRVTNALGTEIARYDYDGLGRRVRKTFPDTTTLETTYSGWRELEEYRNGQIVERNTFGPGLDEIVRLELDQDGDGLLEQALVPVYDSAGNLAMLLTPEGRIAGKYDYSPFGNQLKAKVDNIPPSIEQLRLERQPDGVLRIEINLGEAIDGRGTSSGFTVAPVPAPLAGTTSAKTTQPLAIEVEQPIQDGRRARRRVIVTATDPPEAGSEVDLLVGVEAIADLFQNQLTETFTMRLTVPTAGTAPQVLLDTANPQVDEVRLSDGHLEVSFSEQPDATAAAAALRIDGTLVSWSLLPESYTLRSEQPLAAGAHVIRIEQGTPLDHAGKGVSQTFEQSFTVDGVQPIAAIFEAPDPREVPLETLANRFTFQGRPYDAETGLFYFRNRYYDPEIGRFITPDPLGYVDGPSVYAFALNNPINFSDPMGLESLGEAIERYAVDAYAYGRWWQKGLGFLLQTSHATVQAASAGAVGKIDKSQEALDRGEITHGQYWKRTGAAVGGAAAGYAAGGAAGAAGARLAGAALGARALTVTGRAAVGAVSGAVGGTSGLASSDAVSIAVGVQEGFSSTTDYVSAAAGGAAIGTVVGAAIRPRWKVDPAMRAADEAAGIIVNGRYVRNPSARSLPDLLTDAGKIGGKYFSGQYMYVVDDVGNVIIGTRAGQRMPHPTLIGGANPKVRAAGVIDIRGGRIYSVDNASGHFKPGNEALIDAEWAFSQLPRSAFHRRFQGYQSFLRE